ncbi:MAG: AAA family ATPase, partial [Bacteroidales bacterium]|nr:AAA family ATPase [Bacteroidales bacterium]
MNKLIVRHKYLDIIRPYIGKQIIKVLTGQRRVGKSYILFQTIEEIKQLNSSANILYINKEDFAFDTLKTAEDLYNYVLQNTKIGVKNYVFVDEIQEISDFEKVFRSLLLNSDYDLYCTGSNAYMLSGELASFLSGRYIEIPVYSLSYTEFLEFQNLDNTNETLHKYLKYGGLPYLKHLELQDEIVFNYLKGVYNTIIYKDLIQR